MSPRVLFLTSDARILRLLKEGDEGALATLYEQNRKMVTSYVLRNSGSADEAEDVLQEALVILWERVKNGKHAYTAKLSTFIFATARNLWLRALARRRREPPQEEDDPPAADDAMDPLETLVEEEQSQTVTSALQKLGEPCRTLLLLYYWEERSMEEIAGELGFANAATAKSKKYQCKEALKKLLKELHHE